MTLFLALMIACGTHPHDEGSHSHDDATEAHDADGQHAAEDHHEAHHADGQHEASETAPTEPVEANLGSHTGRLEPGDDAVRLVILAADGTTLPSQGEARMVLTPHNADGSAQEQQRVVLSSDGSGWTGPAKAAGAAGYVAVVSVTIDEKQESGRFSWGQVPAAEPVEHDHDKAHEHGEGGHEHGQGHDH